MVCSLSWTNILVFTKFLLDVDDLCMPIYTYKPRTCYKPIFGKHGSPLEETRLLILSFHPSFLRAINCYQIGSDPHRMCHFFPAE